jgi:hypothetical protein
MHNASITCPHCSFETSSELNFCMSCEQQIFCNNASCRHILFYGKSKCLKCGTPVSEIASGNKYIHTINHTNKQGSYTERKEFQGSDYSIAQIARVLAGQSTYSPPTDVSNRQQSRTGIIPENNTLNLPGMNIENTAQPETLDQNATIASNQPEKEKRTPIAEYFEMDGDSIVPLSKDFKGDNWTNQQKRFIILYAYHYSVLFSKNVPSKEHIITSSQKNQIYDKNNFHTHLSKVIQQYLIEKSDGISLNHDGRTFVELILTEMKDVSKTGFPYWNRHSKPDAERNRLSSEDKVEIDTWSGESVDLGKLDINQLKDTIQYAKLSIWIITTLLKKRDVVKWNEAHYYFTKNTKMSVQPRMHSRRS